MLTNDSQAFDFAAVFFDMDGTLLDSEPYWLEAETELMARYGYSWLLSDQQYCLGGPLKKVGLYMAEIAMKSSGMKELHGSDFEAELIDMVGAKLAEKMIYMPGAQALLQELKSASVKTALVSASPRRLVDQALAGLPANSFEISIAAEDVTRIKPDPEGYLIAASKFEVAIENCLILEDSLTGITAASASGAYVIAIPHLVEIAPAPRRYLVPSLAGVNMAALKGFAKELQLIDDAIILDLENQKI